MNFVLETLHRGSLSCLACTLGAAVALTGAAHAQDGGSRSILAEGAGNRALAMGGSFTALADDASGLLWNPGGIAAIPRMQFQGGQSRYAVFGVSETYAMAALPDWRWGVVASSFRHVGVDDIEVRDERNLTTGTTISDSETEIAFGYGRDVGESWSVGGAFKARRHSLGDLSANGFGLDCGVLGHPLALLSNIGDPRALSVGIALANVVRPTLRLDREGVSDPMTARAGVAWRQHVTGLQSVILTADLEKPSGLSPVTHVGFEYQIVSQFALRGGLNHGIMNAGGGFRWGDVMIDYAFENAPLEPVHRVGLSYGFGHTVEESRAAAQRADEEKLQARLDDAFQSRQNAQIASLLQRAEERRTAGAPEEAIDLLTSVTALDPARTDVPPLLAACYRDRGTQLEHGEDFAGALVAYGRAVSLAPGDSVAQAGQERCQHAVDRGSLRSAEARRLFTRALDAFGQDKLAIARRGFMSVLDVQPDDPGATEMLQRTNDMIARRVQGLMREAERSFDAGRNDDAAALLEQVAQLEPQARGLDAMRTAIARSRVAEQAGRQSAQRDPERERGKRASAGDEASKLSAKELDLFYRRGLAAMQERHSDDALRYWDIVWSASPAYARVAQYLKQELMMRGMEAFAAGRLDEAVSFWRRALRVDPNDQRALGYLERAQQQLARTREILGNK